MSYETLETVVGFPILLSSSFLGESSLFLVKLGNNVIQSSFEFTDYVSFPSVLV